MIEYGFRYCNFLIVEVGVPNDRALPCSSFLAEKGPSLGQTLPGRTSPQLDHPGQEVAPIISYRSVHSSRDKEDRIVVCAIVACWEAIVARQTLGHMADDVASRFANAMPHRGTIKIQEE